MDFKYTQQKMTIKLNSMEEIKYQSHYCMYIHIYIEVQNVQYGSLCDLFTHVQQGSRQNCQMIRYLKYHIVTFNEPRKDNTSDF